MHNYRSLLDEFLEQDEQMTPLYYITRGALLYDCEIEEDKLLTDAEKEEIHKTIKELLRPLVAHIRNI